MTVEDRGAVAEKPPLLFWQVPAPGSVIAMSEVRAIYHRTKETNIFPLDGDLFLIEAFLQDEVHDVHVEVEIVHPSLEITAARAEVRNGPFTTVCNQATPNVERLVGMRVGRGFTVEARKRVGGSLGCHRVSELVVEIAQAAYQLHFVRHFSSIPVEERQKEDDPTARHRFVLENIPGMRNTCFTYNEENFAKIEEASPLRIREQEMPVRDLPEPSPST